MKSPPKSPAKSPRAPLDREVDVIEGLVRDMNRRNPVEFSLPKHLVQHYSMPGLIDSRTLSSFSCINLVDYFSLSSI